MDIVSGVITPTSTSNKILIYGSLSAFSDVNHVGIRLYRNGSHIGDAPEVQGGVTFSMQQLISASFDNNNHGGNNNASYGSNAVLFYDSPSSTSALTYLFKLHQPSTSGVNLFVNGGSNTYQMEHQISSYKRLLDNINRIIGKIDGIIKDYNKRYPRRNDCNSRPC